MAAASTNIRDFANNVALQQSQLEADQQVDPISIAMAFLTIAKALAQHGIHVGRMLLKRLVGGKNEDLEELVEQVDWKDDAQRDPEDKFVKSIATTENSPLVPRELIKDLKMIPEQKDQIRRLQKNWDGLMACQITQYDAGKPPKLDEDDHDQLTRQREKLRQQDEQELHKGELISKALGKHAAWPSGVQQEDNCPDGGEPQDDKKRFEQSIRTKNARIIALETEMRRMKKEFEDQPRNQTTQPTPLQQNIATLETPRAKVTAIILAGIIQKRPRTTDINLISESSDINYKGNGLYRVANGSGGSCDGGGGEFEGNVNEDNCSVGGDTYGRNGRRHDFMFCEG